VARYWLMKSEPDEFSIDDLAAAPNRTSPWSGVRNYRARNFMRDEMRVGDRAFFYQPASRRSQAPRIPTRPSSTRAARITIPSRRAPRRAG
jgi:predicted RNA-binding protein with PUA-like domain